MKLKLLIISFIIIQINCQDSTKIVEPPELPFGYLTITIGGMELSSLSFGKYLNKDFTLSIKTSNFGVDGGSGFTVPASVGIGFNYFFKNILIFNYMSNDYLYIYGEGYKGFGTELVLGNTNKKPGFRVMFELGIGYSNVKARYSSPQYQRKILLGPIIKIGLNYNL